MDTKPNRKYNESDNREHYDDLERTRPRYDFQVSAEGRTFERPDKVRVALVQFPAFQDKGDNLQKSVTLAWQAADQGAQIIAFPEMFMLPWVFSDPEADAYANLADRMDDPIWTPLRTLARDKKVVLVCPFFEYGIEQRTYNSCLIIDANGEIAGRYRKRHLPPDNERQHFTPGDGPFTAFPTRYGRIGVYICWDNFFPEGARALALDGADLVIAPSAASEEHAAYKWEIALQAHALFNGIPWVRVNRIGEQFYPGNFAALADGRIVPLESEPGFSLIDLDYTDTDRIRRDWPFLEDRRPELYQDLAR